MSDKQVEKWEVDENEHGIIIYDENDPNENRVVAYPSYEYAERIANLPVLEDEHRQMKELLIELMGDIAGLIDGKIDGEGCQHRIYLLLDRMGGV